MNNDKHTCHSKTDARCDACEAMFQENLHHLVDEARPPRGAEHDAREKEIADAFGRESGTTSRKEGHPLGDRPDAKRKTPEK